MHRNRVGNASRRVARVAHELLESRRLMSVSASAPLLVFNSIETGQAGAGASPVQTLTVTNTGSSTISLGSGALSIVNDPAVSTQDAGEFAVTNSGSVPASLAAGQSANLTVDFTAPNSTGLKSALLKITTNDATNPVVTVTLHGLATSGTGGANEPSLAAILRAYNIPTIVGDGPNDANAFASTFYPNPPDASSQEVVLQRLVKAGSGPVTIQLISSFAVSNAPTSRFGYYVPGDASDLTQLFTIDQADAQTVNPTAQGATSFDPGSSEFGLYANFPTFTDNGHQRISYSEDALNTWDTNVPRKIRFFPLRNADGSVVANAYVFAAEDNNMFFPPNIQPYDSNDIVGIIRNVQAAPGGASGAVLGLTNLDGVPSTTQMVFNRTQINHQSPDPAGFADIVHDTGTLQITNTGNQTLNITGLSLSDSTNWQIVSPSTLPSASSPLSVAAGGTVNVTVRFIAQTNPPHTDNQTNDTTTANGLNPVDAGGVWSGTLNISSNDAARPVRTVNLAGYWQAQSESENEPGLQTIVNKLFGYTTTIANSALVQYPNNGSQPVYYGEEQPSALWDAADPSLPVSVRQLAAFHGQVDTSNPTSQTSAPIYWYPQGGSNNLLFSHHTAESQSVLPTDSSSLTNPAQATFSPTGAFGLVLDGEDSNDARNTADIAAGRSGHAVRFFPVRDSSGNVVPNSWLVVMDYENSNFDNSDFQDNVYLVTNMRPDAAPAAPTDLQATASTAGVTLQWAPAASGTLTGYNVYSASAPGGPYSKLTSSPITGTSYFDPSAAQNSTVYYRVTSVNNTTESHGMGTSVQTPAGVPDVLTSADINSVPGGSTTVVTPGKDYNITGGGVDIGGSAEDGFRFAYEQVTGDFDAVVQVASLTQNVQINSRAGLIVKDTLDPGSRMVFSGATASDGYRFNYRTVADQPGQFTHVGTVSYPNVWVRMTRQGSVFTTYSSPDGTTWTQTGTLTLALPSTVYLGLAVNSHDTTQTVTAQLRNFSVTQSSTVPTVTPPIGLAATADQNGITLQWSAEAAAAGYNVFRGSSASGPFTLLNSTPLTATTYVDTTAPQGATSFYEVVALDGQGNASGPATTSALRPNTSTTLTFGGRTVATYTDDTGRTVTLRLAGRGSGVATFVNGAATPDSISLTGTTAGSIFSISVPGGSTHVGTIAVTGSLARISAPTTIVQGDIAVAGTLGSVLIGGANGGHTLSVGSGARVGVLNLGQVADLSISTNAAIAAVQVTSWTVNTAPDMINAAAITRLFSAGDFAAGLNLSATRLDLGSATIRGALSAGPWALTGNAGPVVAGSVASGWSGNVGGALSSLNVSGSFGGDLTAATIANLHVGGDLTGTIHTTAGGARDLRVLTVGGAISGGQVRTAGGIGSVTAGALVNANVFAGVSNSVTGLPTSASDFARNASIASVLITERNQPFAVQGSNVAASSLGRVFFGDVNTSNNGTPFGLAAHSLASYRRRVNGQVLTWTSRMSPSLLTASGDSVVELL